MTGRVRGWHGPQQKGAARVLRDAKRAEAVARNAPTGASFPPVSVGVAADGTGVTGPLSSRVQVVSPDPSAATTTKAQR